jgi:hypothetical protein
MRVKTLVSVSAVGAALLGLWACADRTSGAGPTAATASATAAAVTNDDGRASASDAEEKVTICHIPPGNPENAHTITIGASAVQAHMDNHADLLVACPTPTPTPTPGG